MKERSTLGISDFLLLSLLFQLRGKSSQGGRWKFGGLGRSDATWALGAAPWKWDPGVAGLKVPQKEGHKHSTVNPSQQVTCEQDRLSLLLEMLISPSTTD